MHWGDLIHLDQRALHSEKPNWIYCWEKKSGRHCSWTGTVVGLPEIRTLENKKSNKTSITTSDWNCLFASGLNGMCVWELSMRESERKLKTPPQKKKNEKKNRKKYGEPPTHPPPVVLLMLTFYKKLLLDSQKRNAHTMHTHTHCNATTAAILWLLACFPPKKPSFSYEWNNFLPGVTNIQACSQIRVKINHRSSRSSSQW